MFSGASLPSQVTESPFFVIVVAVFGVVFILLGLLDKTTGRLGSLLQSFRRINTEREDALVAEFRDDIKELRVARSKDREERARLNEVISDLRTRIADVEVQAHMSKIILEQEQHLRIVYEARDATWTAWHRDELVAKWDLYRAKNTPPPPPV